jgi:hypothetical protein
MDIKPLNVNIRRTVSNGQVYEMVDYDDYAASKNLYLGRNDVGIAIEYKDSTIVLPLRDSYNGNPISPGVYNAGCVSFVVLPDEGAINKYIPDKIVSIGNLSDVQEIIKAGEEIRKLDEPFITTPDNITKIPIKQEDQPEMKCLKMALNEKNMDLDKYAGRFSQNFPNDKRQLKNTSVTLHILKRFCSNMDMEALLTIRDKNPDVPNPIGKEITVSLTDEFVDDDSSED